MAGASGYELKRLREPEVGNARLKRATEALAERSPASRLRTRWHAMARQSGTA